MKKVTRLPLIGKFIYTLCSGFTTVELLIVMLILLFVTGVATLTYFTAVNTTRDVISISTSEIDARTAIYRMSKDIREATSISLADEDKIRFTSNIDSDDSFEEVYYFLENENGYYNLYRQVNGETKKIVTSNIISNQLFLYYSDLEEDNLTPPVDEAELKEIKTIKINIVIDQEKNQTARTMELSTYVTLRNRTGL